MNTDPERIPVIVGQGQINDRDSLYDSLELMVQAVEAADQDAGGGWIAKLDSVATVAQIAFPQLGNCAEKLVAKLGITPGHVEQTPYPTGESPVQLLHEAANRIGAGEIKVACVAGAEALRTAAIRAKAATGEKRDALRERARPDNPSLLMRHGLYAPTDLYPIYENATRAAWGQSLTEAQAESGSIWAGMSEVAAANPTAWLRQPQTPEAITGADADNRPIAFPYQKRMVANASVNQGAAFIVTSLAEARRAGVPDDKIIHVGMGAAAHEENSILKRDSYSDAKGMRVTIEETLKRNNATVADLDHVELYSCFPCVPKMARRILNWPVDRPITAFGGLTFGGGPIGNYMSHAIGSMVEKLRREGGTALMFANGGFATHFHAIMLSREPFPNATFPHEYDCNPQAKALRGEVPPVDEGYQGLATIESYTVFYHRDGTPRMGSVIARTPEGARTLGHIPANDEATIAWLTDGVEEPVGRGGVLTAHEDGLSRFSRA